MLCRFTRDYFTGIWHEHQTVFLPYVCKVWNVTHVCHCLTRGKSSICIRPPPRQAVRTVRKASFTAR